MATRLRRDGVPFSSGRHRRTMACMSVKRRYARPVACRATVPRIYRKSRTLPKVAQSDLIVDTDWITIGSKEFTIHPKIDNWSTDDINLIVTSNNLMIMTVKNKLESAINLIPGVNVELESVVGEYDSKSRNCCDNGNIVENGEKYKKGSLSLSCEIGQLPIWGMPSITKTICFPGLAEIEITFQAGVYLTASIDVTGYAGGRQMQCLPSEECFFAGVSPSLNLNLNATCEAIICQDTIWTSPTCHGVQVTPASINASITGNVQYNSETNCDGLSCSITLLPIEFVAEFSVNSVGGIYRHTISSGGKIL